MKKSILKKVMALSMAATMLCLTACGNTGAQSEAPVESAEKTSDTTAVVEAKQGESDGETVTIGVWAEDEQKRLEAAVDGVEAATGVKVEFIQYPSDSDFWDNIPAQIAAGTAPDLISCTNEHYLQYIDQGLFESLNEYIDSGTLSTENINEVAMNAWNIDGNVYGIPYALNPGIFVVNNDMWNEFGLGDAYPTTWDEVLDICKKVKEEHNMPALCLNIQEYHLTNYALSFGGGWDYGNNIDAPENAQRLKLTVNREKSRTVSVFAIRNFKFLGFALGRNGKGIYVRVHPKSWKKFKSRLKELSSRKRCQSIKPSLEKIKVYARGWLNYYGIASMRSNIEDINGWLYHRIRMCIWKQWKLPRTKKRNLIKMGVHEYYANMAANCRRGQWYCANLTTVKKAMTKERLINGGFYDLATAYQSVHVNY